MKRFFLILAALLLIGVSVVAVRFFLAENEAFDFAQSQARLGRAYMDGMKDEDFKEVGDYSLELMAQPPPHNRMWNELSKWESLGDKPVPVRWQERGVLFIRYNQDKVSFGWHGGPFAHTQLDVKRGKDGALTFTAHYTDYVEERLLRKISKAQQAGHPVDELPRR
jgi:hypothetical protein